MTTKAKTAMGLTTLATVAVLAAGIMLMTSPVAAHDERNATPSCLFYLPDKIEDADWTTWTYHQDSHWHGMGWVSPSADRNGSVPFGTTQIAVTYWNGNDGFHHRNTNDDFWDYYEVGKFCEDSVDDNVSFGKLGGPQTPRQN